MTASTRGLPAYVQRFFTDRLAGQRSASPNTIASYRDTFRLLLRFAQTETGKAPTDLALTDLDAERIGRFLAHLEEERGNGARSRNVRLAAIRSFFRYVAINEPQLLHQCQRILAIPAKRHERRQIAWLTPDETAALINAPDRTTRTGRRDRAILTVMAQTGLRVSELIGLKIGDVSLETGAHLRCFGKGRKERVTPLRKDSVAVLRDWLRERRAAADGAVFAGPRGDALSRDAVERLVARHSATAGTRCPALTTKKITPHSLRHTAAMDLLSSGVDSTVIALWLGHETVATTQVYVHADLGLKEKAMALTAPKEIGTNRYKPDDALLAYLEAL